MKRKDSSDEDTSKGNGDRSRSREARGRPVRRDVPNPFRSPQRRQPRPVDQWVPQRVVPFAQLPPESRPLPDDGDAEFGETNATATGAAAAAAAAQGNGEQEDVDMGSDGGYYERGQVWNTPAIPQPPAFKGSTKSERRAFMREYQKYLAQINALQCVGSRPFAMPVSACMDPFSKRRIALFDFNKDHNLVTEFEWIAWFNAAFDEDP